MIPTNILYISDVLRTLGSDNVLLLVPSFSMAIHNAQSDYFLGWGTINTSSPKMLTSTKSSKFRVMLSLPLTHILNEFVHMCWSHIAASIHTVVTLKLIQIKLQLYVDESLSFTGLFWPHYLIIMSTLTIFEGFLIIIITTYRFTRPWYCTYCNLLAFSYQLRATHNHVNILTFDATGYRQTDSSASAISGSLHNSVSSREQVLTCCGGNIATK